jgi:thioredoxin 1
MASEFVVELTNENFEKEVSGYAGTVLVDFWAPWCGPCRMVGPVVEELAKEYHGKVKVAKLNTDEAPDVASKFGIRSIPTLLFFKNGAKVQEMVGAYPKSKISEKLEGVLA